MQYRKSYWLLYLVIMLVPLSSGAVNWVDEPTDCPSLDAGNFPGQDCTPDDICGDTSGIVQCFDMSTVSAPTGNTTTTTNSDDGSFNGGYLINCYATSDASAPFCYNSASPTCDRNSSIHTTLSRDTICLGTDAGGGFGQTAIGDCRTNFFQCDGGGSEDDCEIQAGSSCGPGGTIELNECFDAGNGNCTATGNDRDCNNDDSDSNQLTCNGADGCEIELTVDTNNTQSIYLTCTTFECTNNNTLNGYLDCDGSGDGTDANGCEAQNNSACSVGPLSGTVIGCSGGSPICSVDDQDIATTGQEVVWSGTDPMLWMSQLGSGWGINMTFVNNLSFWVNSSGPYWNGASLINTGGGSDLTNVAFINDTQIFAEEQNFSESLNVDQNVTANWFFGIFNWTVLNDWLSFDGSTLSLDEVKLNNTIDDRSLNQTEGDGIYQPLEDQRLSTFNNVTFDVLTVSELVGGSPITVSDNLNGTEVNATFSFLSGDGSQLTNITPGDLTNVAFINDTQIFAEEQNFSENLNVDQNVTANWFFGIFNWTVLNDWLSFDGSTLSFNDTKQNESILDLSLNQTEGDLLYLNLTGTNANENINVGDFNFSANMLNTTRIEFPNMTLRKIETNEFVNGSAYGFCMRGSTGVCMPHFWVQPQGSGQASGIARSFMIVNEVIGLQNNTNITSCQAFADISGEVLQIDCNSSTTGADLLVGDDTQIFGDVWVKDTTGEWHFLTRNLQTQDELTSNTVSNFLDVFISGSDFVMNDTQKDTITITIDGNFTILNRSSDDVPLVSGTNITPQFNWINYQDINVPVLLASTSEPAVSNVHIASILVGEDTNNIYGFVDRFSHDENFVSSVYKRFFEQGALFVSGFVIGGGANTINITGGNFDIMLDEYTTTETLDLINDGFYFINSSSNFIQSTTLSDITKYSDGTTISTNRYFNVVLGVVPVNLTAVRIVAVVQGYPGSGNEYTTVAGAETDIFEQREIFPPNSFLGKIYLPMAIGVMQQGTWEFETLSNGETFKDIKGIRTGASTGGGGGGGVTDHGALTGLSDDDHTQYILANGTRALTDTWNTGAFDINSTADSRIYGSNQTMFDQLTTNFLSWITNVVTGNFFVNGNVNITGNLNVSDNLTILGSSCYNTDCSSRIFNNGSGLLIT